MPRYKLTIEYDGGGFAGWQRQNNGLAVQQVLEDAVRAFSGEAAAVYGAGRTDAGVHALGQAAHFDLKAGHEPRTVRDALNFHAKPHAVSVTAAARVHDDFHARFDALARHYKYRILNRRARPALERGRAWWTPKPLNTGAMAEAAQVLTGKHDFTTFRAAACQAPSPVKTLDMLDVRRGENGDDDVIVIEARGRSFLYHQVRNMAGALVLAGTGKWTPADLRAALEARDRAAGGPTAPAEGLYLMRVEYPAGAAD
ncbi:MAG: tRNA pseudouridine(38-40) synthase TruA [Rhodospirillales bacterium]